MLVTVVLCMLTLGPLANIATHPFSSTILFDNRYWQNHYMYRRKIAYREQNLRNFVGDKAFRIHKHLMRPYNGTHITLKKRISNYRLCSTPLYVECTFGILSNKWRIFHWFCSLYYKSMHFSSQLRSWPRWVFVGGYCNIHWTTRFVNWAHSTRWYSN